MSPQIKSKRRVQDHGEVFTNEKEVKAMLDLVKDESKRIDSTFLEPAAGTGNFLVEILKRKLMTVRTKHSHDQEAYELNAFIAVTSMYGIDILEDNCFECRRRLMNIISNQYKRLYKGDVNQTFLNTIEFVLAKNIIHGDGLTGLKEGIHADGIMFSEWNMDGREVTRKNYAMNDMIAYEGIKDEKNNIPKARMIYPKVDFLKVSMYE